MEIAIHALIIMGLIYVAITLHFITLKLKNNETKKRPSRRQKEKVLHSKPGRNQALEFPLQQKQEEGQDPSPFTQSLIDFIENKQ